MPNFTNGSSSTIDAVSKVTAVPDTYKLPVTVTSPGAIKLFGKLNVTLPVEADAVI